jgi:hypothetical protein
MSAHWRGQVESRISNLRTGGQPYSSPSVMNSGVSQRRVPFVTSTLIGLNIIAFDLKLV